MIWRLAIRNVRLQKAKSAIVGSIFLLGALLSVVGGAVVDAMDVGMRRSVTESLAGQLQIYSADARDTLALYGDQFAGMPDVGAIPDFAAVAKVVRAVPNVKAVVPMGGQYAFIDAGNELDRHLANLRIAVNAHDAAAVTRRALHVRKVIETLKHDLEQAAQVSAADSEHLKALEDVRRGASDTLWAEFERDPLAILEFLENKVAPQQTETGFLGLWFLGTDLDAFAQAFPRFEIVRGVALPPGERGFLLNEGFYETRFKHPVARRLDALMKARAKGERIEGDADLTATRDAMVGTFRRILYQLSPEASVKVEASLRVALDDQTSDLTTLIKTFLRVSDETLVERRDLFYAQIAPHLELYVVAIGEPLTLRTVSRTGYPRSAHLKVYGTFRFKGLEDAGISMQHNLVDLMSFRDLYGFMTPERRAEIDKIRVKVGAQDVAREDAEAALFGGDGPLVETRETANFETTLQLGDTAKPKPFTRAELEAGLAQHAAIVLDDPSPEAIAAAKIAIQSAVDDAGLNLKVVDWQEASGMVGQLVLMVRVVLMVVVLILAVVSLVVINNAMVMATMERVREIGTLRAIGAQRGFITRLFMAETLVLGLFAGGLGAALGAGIIYWMGVVGLPASNEFMTFLYSGARLHPTLTASHLLTAVGNVVVVGVFSTFYPARLASKIQPAEAMASEG